MAEWDALHVVTPDQAERLIARQFPSLAPVDAAPLAAGWDNTAFVVNGRYVFRFPRRPLAVGLIGSETRALAHLAQHLPLPVPVPEYVGRPGVGYPWPYAGYAMLPGVPACRAGLSEAQRAASAAPLGRFLAALHGAPAGDEALAWAPGDELRRADIAFRAPKVRDRLRAVAPWCDLDVGRLAALAESLAGTPLHTGARSWVHGDLYACHILVGDDDLPAGVIDWGDVHLGDPALDLSIAYTFLPASARPAFEGAYGPVDGAAWARARLRALHYGAVLVEYGAATGDPHMRAAGEMALRGVGE